MSISESAFLQFAQFSRFDQTRARFGNVLMYSVCLVSQVIVLG